MQDETREINGVTYKITWEVDASYPDLSWLGEFTDKWQPEAIKRHMITSREYKYFVPGCFLEDHRKALSKAGYSKHEAYTLARSYVLRDKKRLETYGNDWGMMVLTVTAYVNNVAVTDACIGGIESDGNETYHEETITELMAECQDHMLKYAQQSYDRAKQTLKSVSAIKPVKMLTHSGKYAKCPRCKHYIAITEIKEHYANHKSYKELKEAQQAHNERVRSRVVLKPRKRR